MTTTHIILSIIASSAFTTLITWLLNRRTRNVEVEKKKAEITELISSTYANLVEDLKEEIQRLNTSNELLHTENQKLMKLVGQLKRDIEKIKKSKENG